MAPDYIQIANRLEAVERENRKLKMMAISLLVVSGAVLLMGQARPTRIVEAEKFVLKDANGATRARLEMQSDGPTLDLLDSKGFPIISLLAGDVPSLSVCGEWPPPVSGAGVSCDQQVQIGRFSKEQFGVALYGKAEGPIRGLKAAIGVRDGVPSLDLWGKDLSERASLNLDEPGPTLDLSKQGFTASVGSRTVVLLGKDGGVLWAAQH